MADYINDAQVMAAIAAADSGGTNIVNNGPVILIIDTDMPDPQRRVVYRGVDAEEAKARYRVHQVRKMLTAGLLVN